jgi:hypothetical protein
MSDLIKKLARSQAKTERLVERNLEKWQIRVAELLTKVDDRSEEIFASCLISLATDENHLSRIMTLKLTDIAGTERDTRNTAAVAGLMAAAQVQAYCELVAAEQIAALEPNAGAILAESLKGDNVEIVAEAKAGVTKAHVDGEKNGEEKE